MFLSPFWQGEVFSGDRVKQTSPKVHSLLAKKH